MSEIKKGEAVAALAEVSLVTREVLDDGTPAISLHRLVQEVVRQRLGKRVRVIAEITTKLVADAFPAPVNDVRNWPACRRLETHAAAVLTFPSETSKAAQETTLPLPKYRLLLVGRMRVQFAYAVYLDLRAAYGEAEPLMRRALALAERIFGPDHHFVAVCLNKLARLLGKTNRFAEAEPLMRRALAISEKNSGPDHHDVTEPLNNLAALLQATDRLSEAEPLIRRSLAISEKSLSPDDPEHAIESCGLAAQLWKRGRVPNPSVWCARGGNRRALLWTKSS